MTEMQHRFDGPADGLPLILGPSIGTTMRIWCQQVPALSQTFRVLRFDLPGHGGSPLRTTAPKAAGETTVSALGRRVLDLADAYGLADFHLAGVSLSGAIGATLAIEHPDRLRSLTMVCASARFGDPQQWRDRAASVRANGTGDLVEPTSKRWFATPMGALATQLLDDLRTVDPESYACCCDALAAYDVRDKLASITVPTLVISGRDDPATPPSHGREIVDGIGEARLAEIPHAAHIAPVDAPEAVTDALLSHLIAASR